MLASAAALRASKLGVPVSFSASRQIICTPLPTSSAARRSISSRVAALVEIGDQHQDGLAGRDDHLLAIGQRTVDVRAAAELGAEQQIDGVLQIVGEVDDRGVEDDHARGDGANRGQHRAEDAGVDHRGRHRAALVDAEDDVAQRGALVAVADQPLGDDGALLGQIVLQVGADGAVPVDLVGAWTVRPRGAVEAATHRLHSGFASLRSSSSTTLRTTCRAVSLVFSGITLLSESRVATRCTSGSTFSSNSGSSSICVRFRRSSASCCITRTDAGGEVGADVAQPARDLWR